MPDKSYSSHPKSKIVILVGPTSSGKSELAVALAKKFNGEIISCDSRQIYRGMDLGTGKIEGKWTSNINHGRDLYYVYKNIPHYCIDYVNPRRQYSASLFQRDAKKAIANVLKRGKLPILCGGTAHWIDAVIFDQQIPDVKPNFKLRSKLEKQPTAKLFQKLIKLDPARAKSIDQFNKRRLIRALEIVITTKKPVPNLKSFNLKSLNYSPLWLGLNPGRHTLYKKIDQRLRDRLRAGMINEVQRLHSPPKIGGAPRQPRRGGISWKRLESFGLEYKFVSLFLQKKIDKQEMIQQLSLAIKHYSKRQLTWWKRNKNIRWVKNPSQIQKILRQFV